MTPQTSGSQAGGTGAKKSAARSGNPKTSIGRNIGGIAAALGVALVAALFWVFLWGVAGLQLGILAWGAGGLIGLVAGAIARNPSPVYCGGIAAIAAGTVFTAKIIMALLMMAASAVLDFGESFAENFNPNYQKLVMAVEDEMLGAGELEGPEKAIAEKRTQEFFNNESEGYWDDEIDEAAKSLTLKVREKIGALSANEKNACLSRAHERHPGWFDNDYDFEVGIQALIEANEFSDDKIKKFAEETLKLNGEEDSNYFNDISYNEQEANEAKLRKMASTKLAALNDDQQDEVLRRLSEKFPQWVVDDSEFTAIMSSMSQNGEFSGKLDTYAKKPLNGNTDGRLW